ncbi:fumarate hydratase [Clostridia bacterium]|nr:fumarate hydratase [Clostridia bacterium]GHU76637.1 fumarate hydratase [Clostridia bacterium]
MIRELDVQKVTETVSRLCVSANIFLNEDIKTAFAEAKEREKSETAKDVLSQLLQNAEIARESRIPICQDTGMAVVFLEIGQDLHLSGGDLYAAVNKGVAHGYETGYLRKSVVSDPISRLNTKDNTPAIIHTRIVGGDSLKIIVAPKGFGSENMSGVKMLKPSDGIDGVKAFVLDTVKNAGSNPCPPIVAGVGVGGTMEYAALMAKHALLLPVTAKNPDEFWAGAEKSLLDDINKQGVGAAGFGGVTTALAVHINVFPTHIAGLPVAVNIGCHVTRHAEEVL